MAMIPMAAGETRPPSSADIPGVAQIQLPRSEAFSLSAERGGEYWIEVALPAAPAPAAGYRVLYVLDGNARLPLLRAARETLTRGSESPLLLVGIGYPDVERFDVERRTRDYTPRLESPVAEHDGGGGAAAFLDFIEQRLKPYIAKRYRVDESRQALFGHSFGGLFSLYVMQQCPRCFQDYIAISPSLWWQHEMMMPRFREGIADPQWCAALTGRRLLLGVGGKEQAPRPKDGDPQRDALRKQRAMVDNATRLGQLLQAQCPELATTLQIYPGESHGSVVWPAARSSIELLATPE